MERAMILDNSIYEREASQSFNAPLPFIAGDSPFLCKGLALSYSRNWIMEKCGEAFFEALPDDESRRFFREPIVATGWYDIFPILHLIYAAAEMMRIPVNNAMGMLIRGHAENDINRIHKMLLKVVAPSDIVPRLKRLSDKYWNFGGVELEMQGSNIARVVRTGVPARLQAYFESVGTEYMGTVLKKTGWQVAISPLPWRGCGEDKGVPIIDIPFEFTWYKR